MLSWTLLSEGLQKTLQYSERPDPKTERIGEEADRSCGPGNAGIGCVYAANQHE